MRIIAGQLGGRQFSAPHGHRTRPMSDKVRGALFNSLGDVNGLTVLDAFAGSGALAFEAISRGALKAVAIDSDRSAQMTIAVNIKQLGLEKQVKLIKAGAGAWLSTSAKQFDIVLCDPPYDDPQPNLLLRLAERVNPGGVIVFSLPPKMEVQLPSKDELLSEKAYGDASLRFYRKTG